MRWRVLQAYSQDAYLKGNEAYSGNAQHIPEPPPICYPRIEVKTAGAAPTTEPVNAAAPEAPRGSAQGPSRQGGAAEKGYRVEISIPPSPPPLPRDPATRVEPSHRTEENRYAPPAADPGPVRARLIIPTLPGEAQLQPPPSDSPVFTPPPTSGPGPAHHDKLSPAPRTAASPTSPGLFSPSGAPRCSPSQHKNIDWKNYTTYKDYIDSKRLHTYGCRTIQERLDSLRAATTPGSAYAQQHTPPPSASGTGQRGLAGWRSKPRSVLVDRGGADGAGRTLVRSVSQEKLGCGSEPAVGKWPRSSSEDALPLSSPPPVPSQRAKSCDHLGRRASEPGGAAAGERAELETRGREGARMGRPGAGLKSLPHLSRTAASTGQEDERRSSPASFSPLAAATFTKGPSESAPTQLRKDGVILRPSRLPVRNSAADPSPLSCFASGRTADYLRYQRSNLADGPPAGLHLQLRCRADSLNLESRSEPGLAARTFSCSAAYSQLSRPVPSAALCSSHTNGDVSPKARPGGAVCTNGTVGDGMEGRDATVVVLRRDKSTAGGAPPHIRPPSYVQALNDSQRGRHRSPPLLVKAGSEDGAMCRVGRDRQLRRVGDVRQQKSDSLNLDDSLDSIPFIGEAPGMGGGGRQRLSQSLAVT